MHPESQLAQMEPGSLFLQWLNSSPTFTNFIKHYILCGRKNNLKITEDAWTDPPPDFSLEIEVGNLPTQDELTEHIGPEGYMNIEDINAIKLSHSHYENPIITPNDGVVSVEDASLPGAHWIDLGEHAEHITHNGIYGWFLKDEHHQFVKNKVLEIYEKLIYLE